LSGVVRFRLDPDKIIEGEPSVLRVEYSYAIVLSQSSDLTQDFNGRKDNKPQLPDVLFCQVPTAEELRATPGINSTLWDRIKKNKDERYHFLEKVHPGHDLLGTGLPEMTVDFKRYFTVPTEEIYTRLQHGPTVRRTVLNTPYLEHLGNRFAFFVGRVGLPREHISE
jgi:hypothetical protein